MPDFPILYFVRTDNDSDCFIIKIDEKNYCLIDSGPAHPSSYQIFKSAISKCKISNFKRIIITNPRKKHLGGITRFLKEYFSPKDIHAEKVPQLDLDVVLTEEFSNKQIIDILSHNGFEVDNKKSNFVYRNIIMDCIFHKNGKPLILRHKKDAEQDVNAVGNNDNVTLMRNNAKIQKDQSSILTYFQYFNDGMKKSVFLTSDNVASWIQKVLATRLNLYQPTQQIERPYIDIFQ
ncbi:34381_t:CDS:1, partial [Racocetra persica]